MDLGKSVDSAGWLILGEEDLRHLQGMSFCEIDRENMKGRINPSSKLPRDLLLEEEGRVFSQYAKSLDIIREIREKCENEEKYHNAIVEGLRLMFQRARYIFWEDEGGVVPNEIRSLVLSPRWVEASRNLANLLVKDLLLAIYGNKGEYRGLNAYEASAQESYGYDLLKVFNNLKSQWKKIVDYLREHVELVEFLGLIWFAFKRAAESEIDYVGTRVLIFEEILKVVANKRSITEDVLRRKLKIMGEELDNCIEGDSWGLRWDYVFTIPW